MILINSILINDNETGWTYYCNIFKVHNQILEDITVMFENIWGVVYDEKSFCLKIPYWSWTAYSRIKDYIINDKEFIKKHDFSENDIKNIEDISLDRYWRIN